MSKGNYLTIVPNNENGKLIIARIREMAKRNGWTVVLRGRQSNRKAIAQKAYPNDPVRAKYFHDNLRRSVTLKYADRICVYVRFWEPATRPDGRGGTYTYNEQIDITPDVLAKLDNVGKVKYK
jgi:hypothetical protein